MVGSEKSWELQIKPKMLQKQKYILTHTGCGLNPLTAMP